MLSILVLPALPALIVVTVGNVKKKIECRQIIRVQSCKGIPTCVFILICSQMDNHGKGYESFFAGSSPYPGAVSKFLEPMAPRADTVKARSFHT